MGLHVYSFLLLLFLILSLVLLWRLCTVSFGLAAQTIAPPVVSPPQPRRQEG